MIVTCEGCNTRFHLADAQVPPQGARVRCSKCHHRFLVKPSDAESEEPPSIEPAAQTSPIPTPPQSESTTDEPDLDNPEFLFDAEDSALAGVFGGRTMPLGDETRQVDASEIEHPGVIPELGEAAIDVDEGHDEAEHAGVEEAALTPEAPESSPEIAAGDGGLELPDDFLGPDGDQEDAPFGDAEVPTGTNLGDVQEYEQAEAPGVQQAEAPEFEIDSAGAADFTTDEPAEENPLATSSFEEMDAFDQPFTPLASSETESESAESGLVGSDPEPLDPMDLLGGEEPDLLSPEEQPDPEVNPLAGPELDAEDLLSGVLDEEDDGDPMGSWDPLAGADAPAPSAPLSLGAIPPAASNDSVEAKAPPATRLEVPAPPSETEADLMGGRFTERLLRMAAIAAGLFLAVAGVSAMATHGLGREPGPETLHGAGWVATDIEALQLRDASERRVLVLRGLLLPQSGGQPPVIRARLLDDRGVAIGPPHRGVPMRLDNPELSPQALSAALAPGARLPDSDAKGTNGFTVLIPEPAPGARRFEIELLGVRPETASRGDS